MCFSGLASNAVPNGWGVRMNACMSCGATEGVAERDVPLRTVACDDCWDDAVHFPEREPEQIDVELTVEQLRPDPSMIREKQAGRHATTAALRAPGTARCAAVGSCSSQAPTRPTRFHRASDGGSPVTARR